MRYKSNFNFWQFFALLCILASLISQAHAAQICSETLLSQLKNALKIKEGSNIRASACKSGLEGEGATVLAVVAYDPPTYIEPSYVAYSVNELAFQLALFDTRTSNALTRHEEIIFEDPVTHVVAGSLSLDTAQYFLAKDIRSVGVRVSATIVKNFSEGGEDDYLTLFVPDKGVFRPVLSGLPMRRWSNEGGTPGGSNEKYIQRISNLTLQIAQVTTHGFFDLFAVAKTNGRNGTVMHRLQYNGEYYPFVPADLWMKLQPSD